MHELQTPSLDRVCLLPPLPKLTEYPKTGETPRKRKKKKVQVQNHVEAVQVIGLKMLNRLLEGSVVGSVLSFDPVLTCVGNFRSM